MRGTVCLVSRWVRGTSHILCLILNSALARLRLGDVVCGPGKQIEFTFGASRPLHLKFSWTRPRSPRFQQHWLTDSRSMPLKTCRPATSRLLFC